jgi:hypothetical protein
VRHFQTGVGAADAARSRQNLNAAAFTKQQKRHFLTGGDNQLAPA